MLIFQLVLLLILIPLTLGPLGRYLTLTSNLPDLIFLVAWLFTWIVNRSYGLRWAVMAGLCLDGASYLPFGLWTLRLGLAVVIIDWLKSRYLEVSSPTQAMIALSSAFVLSCLVVILATNNFDFMVLLQGLAATLVAGLILYYALAIRLRLFQQWFGGRL